MREFGCMMALVDLDNWEEIKSQVDQADVYDPDGDHGFASKPHVTMMYGMHQVDIHNVLKFVSDINPMMASFGEVSLFENELYDVLKVTIVSDDLHKINSDIRNEFEVTETFPEYKPHMTICYLNKGSGKKYLEKIVGIPAGEWTMNKIEYEDPMGQKLYVCFSAKKS